MSTERVQCSRRIRGVLCSEPAFLCDQRKRKNARGDTWLAFKCARHMLEHDKQVKRKREAPTEADIECRQRAATKYKESDAYEESKQRTNERLTASDTTTQAHHLVRCALRVIIIGKKPGNTFMEVSDFIHQDDVRDFFDQEARACGFQNGLEDYGSGAHQWSVAHKIPLFAYDGLDVAELTKAWHSANMTCMSLTANKKQGRKFDETQVPSHLWPKQWNGVCSEQARADVMRAFAYQD